jgi:hypothetical protein
VNGLEDNETLRLFLNFFFSKQKILCFFVSVTDGRVASLPAVVATFAGVAVGRDEPQRISHHTVAKFLCRLCGMYIGQIFSKNISLSDPFSLDSFTTYHHEMAMNVTLKRV